jgi:hypothetical protein
MNEARDHRRQIVPSVEAVFEFDEVPRDALAIDRAMGSGDCSLNIAARSIDLFQGWRAGHRGPESVLTTWCVHPASATLVKH